MTHQPHKPTAAPQHQAQGQQPAQSAQPVQPTQTVPPAQPAHDTHSPDELTQLLRRERPRVWLSVLLVWCTAMAGTALLGLSGGFLTATALAGAAGVGSAFNFFSPSAGIRALTMARIVSRYFEKLVSHDTTLRLARDLRVWFFRRALPLAPHPLGGQRMGDVLARVMSDIAEVDGTLVRAWGPLAALAGLVVCAVVAAGLLYPPAALLLAALAALLGLLWPRWALHGAAGREAQRADTRSALRAQVFEGLEGLADLTALGNRPLWHQRVQQQAQALAAHDRRRRQRLLLGQGLHGMLAGLGLVAMLALALAGVQAGQVTAPRAAGAVFLTVATLELLAGVGLAWQSLHAARAAAQRLRALTAQQPAVADDALPNALAEIAREYADTPSTVSAQASANAQPSAHHAAHPSAHPAAQHSAHPVAHHLQPAALQLHHITFGRPGQPQLIQGLSLHLAPGERVAIRGDSGCGKSTLSELVLRLWDPDSGAITWGGTDLRAMPQHHWHTHIAWLPQGAPVFAGTVADNLRLGDPQASDERLWQALGEVKLAAWAQQREGLHTWVGENGATLSAGQARRLALARALLRPAPLMLLDEPTEGLDVDTANAVMHDLAQALGPRSLIVITHAPLPSGVVQRQLWLRGGRLVDEAQG